LWLSYTYLFVRMLRNPLAYGVGWEELTADPRLEGRRYPTPFFLHPQCSMQLSGIRVTRLGSILRICCCYTPFFMHPQCVTQLSSIRVTRLGSIWRMCCCYTTFFLHLTMFDAAQRYQTHKARLSFGNLLLLSFDTAPPGGSLFQHVKVMINPAFMPQIGRPHCLCHLCHNKCCFTQQFPAPAKEFCYLTPCRQNSDSDASDCLSLLLSCYTAACSL